MATSKRKYLVVRLSSIGDIILTTPILRSLKGGEEEVELHFLVKKSFAFVTEHLDHIDQVWHYEKDNLTELVRKLKQEQFDLYIDLHNNIRSLRLKSQLGVPSVSFNKLNVKKWLLVNTKFNLLPDISIVDRYFDGLASLGLENDGKGLDFKLLEDVEFKEKLRQFSSQPIVISLGASFYTKRIPKQKIIELLSVLNEAIILIGGKDVITDAEEIVQSCPGRNILNLCGTASLNQSAMAIEHAAVLLTSDSGMMHIGAALRTKMVVCWGNTVPHFGMGPYYGREAVDYVYINELPSCKPCSKLGYDACPKGHFKCMNDISINRLKEAINRLI